MVFLQPASLCVVFALRREWKPFSRFFSQRHCLRQSPHPLWLLVAESLRLLVLETGVGPARASQALDEVLCAAATSRPGEKLPLIVSAGFAGALTDELRVGDVLLIQEGVDDQGRVWHATWPALQAAGHGSSESVAWRTGRLLTLPRLLATPEEKHTWQQCTRAQAVDMESAALAACCARHGIPFGCVRVISDEVQTSLSPVLLELLDGGRFSCRRLGRLFSARLFLQAWRLAGQTRFAAHRLSAALWHLLMPNKTLSVESPEKYI